MSADPAAWRTVMADSVAEVGLEYLADQATEALALESPVLTEDPDLRELARRSTLANLGVVADLLRGTAGLAASDPPPQAVAYARALARRNIPLTELARAYRVAQHTMWRFGMARLREALTDAADVGEAIEAYTDATFRTGEVLMSIALERYGVERERWVRSVDAIRRQVVQELLAGGPVDVDAASSRLGYELRRTHVAFVVWGDEVDAMPESVAVAVGGRSALIVALGEQAFAGWCTPEALDTGAAVGGRIAVGLPATGVRGFRSSHLQALEARRVTRLSERSGPTAYADVALLALLTADTEQARAFVERELAGLAAPDVERLAETALEVLLNQGSPRRAALKLGLHENTVAKRIRAAEEILERQIDARPAETLAALLILQGLRGRECPDQP